MNIENSSTGEARSVVFFLNAKYVRPLEIHRQMVAAYDDGVVC